MRSIILKKNDKGEADELVTFFSRDCGWMTGIAKNSKKSRVRFGGNLEPFAVVELNLRRRKRDDLVWIDDATMVKVFNKVRLDAETFAWASYFLELASIFSGESQTDEKLFDYVEELLGLMDDSRLNPSLAMFWEMELLGLLGYSPTLNVCPVCSGEFKPNESGVFSLEMGGVCHVACPSGNFDRRLHLSPDTLTLLRKAFVVDRNLRGRMRLNSKGQIELRRALSSFVRWLRGADVKSLRFMENMGFVCGPENQSDQ